nr:MAG: hypothetical protein [Microviridae sp.]
MAHKNKFKNTINEVILLLIIIGMILALLKIVIAI